jgi:DNA-binding MarR family transcriptional regulator
MVLLTRLSRVVYRRATEDLLGMRLKQYIAVSYLRDQGRTPQQELGEALHLDPNNLVLLLNDLEDDGLVERRRDPNDRRRHLVHLTGDGKRMLRRLRTRAREIEDEFLAPLSDSERADLHALLLRLAEMHEPRCAPLDPR